MTTNKPEVKRYEPESGYNSVMRKVNWMQESESGGYIRFDDYEALQAECEELRKDAERYRWLRKGAVEDVAVVRGLGAMDYGMSAVVSTYSEEIDGDDLDAAIDAAMAKENE